MIHASRWKRSLFWLIPVHRNEIKKFLPILGIFFLLTFVYDLLRPLKSALIIAEPDIGTELIPYIKVWGVLPGAFLLTWLTIHLGHFLNRERVFYGMMGLYIGFFGFFLFGIYPFREELELHSLSQWLIGHLPTGMAQMGLLVQKWHLVLFYTMTELWGNILLSMLFWGFANEMSTVDEARRFYPLFLLGANSAAIFSGASGSYFSKLTFSHWLPYGKTPWDQAFFFFIITAILGAVLITGLFRWVHKLHPHLSANAKPMIQDGEEKVRLTIPQCLVYVIKNPYLACLALIVLGYNLVFNLSDILWTNELSKSFRNDINGYAHYTSQVTQATGVISVFLSLFITGNVLRRFGWRAAALLTPLMVLVCAVGFFYCLNTGSMGLTLLLGTMQMAVSRGAKYTVFDTTKEIAFIPLSSKDQRLGKAVIDGIGSRLGKSSGSFIFQMLFLMMNTLDETVPVITGIVLVSLLLWILAVVLLGRKIREQEQR
jgi:AAA family ATP:ADP antiporter